jgi:uncharacterized delta-60 repeat protein
MKYFTRSIILVFVFLLNYTVVQAQVRYIHIDSSFGKAGQVFDNKPANPEESVYSMDIQNDGKIVITGATGNAGRAAMVARFMSTGIIDVSFGNNGYCVLPYNGNIGNSAGGIKVLQNGKIVVNGSNDSSGFIVRLKSNGTIDSAFGHNGFTVFVRRQYCLCPGPLLVLQDGSIITKFDLITTPNNPVLVKTDSNGVIDNNFGTAGELVVNEIVSSGIVVLDYNDRILVSGSTGILKTGIVRILANGTHDNSFGVSGLIQVVAHDTGASSSLFVLHPTPILLPDNSIIFAGDDASSVAATHILANGVQDKNYGTNGLAITAFKSAYPVCGVVIGNNEVLMMGEYDYISGPNIFTGELSALTSDGKIDPVMISGYGYIDFQYDSGAGTEITTPEVMRVLPGGKIITAGATESTIWLARYNYAGFGSGIEINNPSVKIELYPNPSGNYTIFNYQSLDKKGSEIKVVDINGKTVFEKFLSPGQMSSRIETSGWSNGVYFIQLQSSNEISNTKMIVAH